MQQEQRRYIAIDLKSFYASVECVERGLDPLDTNLVVADESRTQKTICLAVSPSLKSYGVGGRPRLFEVVRAVRQVNEQRRHHAPNGHFTGKSYRYSELLADPSRQLDYIVAPPRMARYIEYSARIYRIYLKYVAPEDIHVYSVDEVFIDATSYLRTSRLTVHDMALTMIRDILKETGVTATAGIGTNLYLAKVAMDIVAKKLPADKDGVRIAQLDERSYRCQLWTHEPLTDFWRVGRGTAKRLAPYGIRTMGDIARASLQHEWLLYRLFGVNAELLIDHAWGQEPCTIEMIKAYHPETHSLSSGQVLTQPYDFEKALVVLLEMVDGLALDLLDKGLVTDHIVVDVGYDVDNLNNPALRDFYHGEIVADHYGRLKPKSVHGSENIPEPTFSVTRIGAVAESIYRRIVNPHLTIRRLNITAAHVVPEVSLAMPEPSAQLHLFVDYEEEARKQELAKKALERERRLMHATLKVKKKYGKNALLKGLDYRDGATARERNRQIGGHKA